MSNSKFLIDLSTSKDYVKLIDKAYIARSFLENHPATGGSVFDLHSHLWYSAQEVCKRGFCRVVKTDGVTLYYTPENYSKYKTEFDKVFKEGEKKEFAKIDVPYEHYYGEPWIFDHISYWSEMNFVVYKGTDYKNYFKQDNWEKFSGISANGRCFEEMVINTANKYRITFGDFSKEDFLTTKEKKNHEKHCIFKSVVLHGKHEKLSLTGLVSNEKHIHVTSAEISHRWARWYAKTPHGQKHFKESLKEVLKDD
jgi:hypothetical protein